MLRELMTLAVVVTVLLGAMTDGFAQGGAGGLVVSGGKVAYPANAMQLGMPIPSAVDRNQAKSRIVVMLPRGVLLVDLTATINGEPFQTPRERLIDAYVKEDGAQPKWAEVLANPRLSTLRITNQQYVDQMSKQYDRDQNGFASRFEVRGMLAGMYAGPAIAATGSLLRPATAPPTVTQVFDTSGDGIIDAKELSAVPARLYSRDANEDELVDSVEINGLPNYGGYVRMNGRAYPAPSSIAFLHSELDWKALHDTLGAHYGGAPLQVARLALTDGFSKQIDINADGQVNDDELLRLMAIPAQVEVEVHLGKANDTYPKIELRKLADDLGSIDIDQPSPGEARLTLPGVTLRLIGEGFTEPNFGGMAESMLRQFDKDKNAYLEKSEFEPQQAAYYDRQFTLWDANTDGKVYKDEIETFNRKMQEPMWDRVAVSAARLDDPALALLDTNADGRLGLREQRTAADRLRTRDANGDGRIVAEELPEACEISFRLGFAGTRRLGDPLARAPQSAQNQSRPSEWFVRMDRNGDGDVSRREFPGTDAQFQKLDTNQDSLIDPNEAK